MTPTGNSNTCEIPRCRQPAVITYCRWMLKPCRIALCQGHRDEEYSRLDEAREGPLRWFPRRV